MNLFKKIYCRIYQFAFHLALPVLPYREPENYIARENMLKAAYKAGIAFSKSYVGYIHAVAHSLGGQYNTAHGLANSIVLPIVLEEYGKKFIISYMSLPFIQTWQI